MEADEKWPRQIDDLEKTSLPAKSPYCGLGLSIMPWSLFGTRNLNPNPRDNAGHILAYHDKGLIAKGGKKMGLLGRSAHRIHQDRRPPGVSEESQGLTWGNMGETGL
jgi:hypothetical protein